VRRNFACFIDVYNFGRLLKKLKVMTAYECICKCWTSEPARVILSLIRQMPGQNT